MNETVTTETAQAIENEAEQKTDWKSHIAYAAKFMGSDAEYCRRNGLNLGTFKQYKKQFGMTRSYRNRKAAFVQVTEARTEQPTTKPLLHATRAGQMPDARWVAEFVIALMVAGR